MDSMRQSFILLTEANKISLSISLLLPLSVYCSLFPSPYPQMSISIRFEHFQYVIKYKIVCHLFVLRTRIAKFKIVLLSCSVANLSSKTIVNKNAPMINYLEWIHIILKPTILWMCWRNGGTLVKNRISGVHNIFERIIHWHRCFINVMDLMELLCFSIDLFDNDWATLSCRILPKQTTIPLCGMFSCSP